MTLIDRLTAAIEERAAKARAAAAGPWQVANAIEIVGPCASGRIGADDAAVSCGDSGGGVIDTPTAEHIAHNDPATVLRMCDAHRRIVADWLATISNPYEGKSDDELHRHWMHPAYEYETTEGQRKAWDGVDDPPWDSELGRPGDGWELNKTLRDPDAFERFDYHEERYWRRLRPGGPLAWTPPEPPSYIVHLAAGYDLTKEDT